MCTYNIGDGTNNRQQEGRQIELVDDVASTSENDGENQVDRVGNDSHELVEAQNEQQDDKIQGHGAVGLSVLLFAQSLQVRHLRLVAESLQLHHSLIEWQDNECIGHIRRCFEGLNTSLSLFELSQLVVINVQSDNREQINELLSLSNTNIRS